MKSWPTKDIAYVGIVGMIMLMALLEWFLWLAAFCYCMYKVFRKASEWSTKILVVVITIIFTCLRCVFLPIMIVTLPLPSQVTKYFPKTVVSILQWFAFWSFSGLLTIPWLLAIYQLVTKSVGRKGRIKQVLDEDSAPKVVIVMPCYNEKPEILVRTVDSIVDCKYPKSCIHVFLSFDGDAQNDLYLKTIERLGIPLGQKNYPKSIDVPYRNTRVTVSRFPHGGKRSCQKKTFKLIDKIYMDYLKQNDNLFILFIDSDCILHELCIQNFMYEMELKPGSSHDMLAMTGVITSTTESNSLITLIQDQEYVHGQLFERTIESGCGAVTCLPGALTLLRFSAFRKMAKYYFADQAEQCEDLFDFCKCHLGEDRWLTHLFMIGARKRYQISMNTGAFCKTEAVQSFRSLLKQRRRWFLGFITNEVCMLTDLRLWRRYPFLLLMRFAQNTIRTTALLFFIMCIAIMSTEKKVKDLPVGFIGVSLGLNWALMMFFAWQLGRWKLVAYPLMFVVNPFLNWMYMVYGIFTAGQRTWGGPRADAAKADAETSVQEAIEEAKEGGDELNIVPETFKAAVEARGDHPVQHVPLHPPSQGIAGRFTSAWNEPLDESEVALTYGYRDSSPLRRTQSYPYNRASHRQSEMEITFADDADAEQGYTQRDGSGTGRTLGRSKSVRHPPRKASVHPHLSYESLRSHQSTTTEVFLPRRPESFLRGEAFRQFRARQKSLVQERPEGGTEFASPAPLSRALTRKRSLVIRKNSKKERRIDREESDADSNGHSGADSPSETLALRESDEHRFSEDKRDF